MTLLSVRTLGLLVNKSSQLYKSDIRTMLMTAGIYSYGHQVETNNAEILRSRLLGASEAAEEGDTEARRGLLRYVEQLLAIVVPNPGEDGLLWFVDLREALLADGFEVTWYEHVETMRHDSFMALRKRTTIRYELRLTDASHTPLAEQITALERELGSSGYEDALNNYRQAVDNLTQGQHEAANGQLRTMLEDLVMSLAKEHAGYVGVGKAGEGGKVIKHLLDTDALPRAEGGLFLHGLWQMIQRHGPHPGRSNADEARFRMTVVTATARFLLAHFQA